MKKKMITTLKFIIVIALMVLIIVHKNNTPRILVIHSYNVDYSWTRDVNIGLNRKLKGNHDIIVRFHYMDLKTNPGEEFRRKAKATAHKLIQTWRPDIIILFDDRAQELVAKNTCREDKQEPNFKEYNDIHIVFGGVNSRKDCYDYGTNKVTGIFERKPLEALRQLLIQIGRNRKLEKPKIAFLGDESPSIKSEISTYSQFRWKDLVWLGDKQVNTLEKWGKQVEELSLQADILLVTNYRQLKENKKEETNFVEPKKVMMKTLQNFKRDGFQLPVVGMNYFNVDDGAPIAVGPSPYEQGSEAGEAALQIARGTKTGGSIPVKKTRQFIISIKKDELDKCQIKLPPIYEAFARATGNFKED